MISSSRSLAAGLATRIPKAGVAGFLALGLSALPARDAAAAAPVEVRFVTIAPEGTPWSEQLEAMKARVEKESGGRILFKLYLGGQLGGEVETLRSLQRGRVQAWGGSVGALAGLVPELQLTELPYLFHTLEEADHVLDDVLFRPYADLLAKKGLALQSWNENGWRHFGSRHGPILAPADLKGVKARSQPSPIHLRMWKALGANPVAISVPEVLTSLQTGVVDVYDNSSLFATATSWHTATRHYSMTQHMYQAGAVVYNKSFLDKLPGDLRKVLLGDAKAEAALGRAGVRALEPEVIKLMEAEGVKIHRSTESERRAFARVLEPLHDEFAKTVGADLLTRTRKALADFRASQKPAAPDAPATPAPSSPSSPGGSPGTPAPKPMPKPPFPKPQVPK